MNGGIEVADLCFSYNEREILHEVTFDVQSGQLVTILGPNGSGKTTLLKCINLLLQPVGSIRVNGIDISEITSNELAKMVGYVPQMHTPAFAYRVLMSLSVAGHLISDSQCRKREIMNLAFRYWSRWA